MNFYLFPKNFQSYALEEMMQTVAECGFDGPTAMVRNGYWLTAENAAQMLPRYVECARSFGLSVEYGSAELNMDRLLTDPAQLDLLKALSAAGVRKVRLQHVAKKETDDVRAYADRFRRQAENAAKAGELADIQCVVQIHGMCYPHNATAAYAGVQGLDPRYIGVKLDPGNNVCQEGYELYWYQIRLLGEYLAAVGAKDVGYFKTPGQTDGTKGWHQQWLPGYEGMIDYSDVFARLREAQFDGPVILMPFYDCENRQQMIQTVAEELKYYKNCCEE